MEEGGGWEEESDGPGKANRPPPHVAVQIRPGRIQIGKRWENSPRRRRRDAPHTAYPQKKQPPNSYFTPSASLKLLSSPLKLSLLLPYRLPFQPSLGIPPINVPPPIPPNVARGPPPVLNDEGTAERGLLLNENDEFDGDDEEGRGADSLALEALAAATRLLSSDSGDPLPPNPSYESSSPPPPPILP